MIRRRSRDVARVLTAIACIFLLYYLYLRWKAFLFSNHSAEEWKENHRRTRGQSELIDVQTAVKTIAINNEAVPVFVVEEHHEVLGYWFLSAEHGIIPKKKNVLLHIDGHGDGAPPILLSDFPAFSWPKSPKAILAMMQRNDVFIMAAGLTGLVHRYIWVWPTWDAENHEDEGSHSVWKAELGTVIMTEGPKILCGCWQSIDNPQEMGCHQQNPSSGTDGAFIPISRSQCKLRITAMVEFVSEDKALELLQGGKWITSEESVMLDIDEDFYGCESVASSLYEVGLYQNLLNRISDLVSFLFCATNAEDEKSADLFYYAIIEMILKMKIPCQRHTNDDKTIPKDCVPDRDIDAVMIQLLQDLHTTLTEQHLGRSLCDENKLAQMLNLQSIVRTLVPLNVSQLVQLAETGICLRTSPRGWEFNANEGMVVCQGSNLPNSSAVFFHLPVHNEMRIRMTNLGQIFSALKKSAGLPALVTIARSMRDGYTPRSYFHRIETELLQMVKETFSDLDHTTVIHFDSQLLGGKGGWPHRHKWKRLLPSRKRRRDPR